MTTVDTAADNAANTNPIAMPGNPGLPPYDGPTSSERLLCLACPDAYFLHELYGRNAKDELRPWMEVRLTSQPPQRKRRLGRKQKDAGNKLSTRERIDLLAQGWEPVCPNLHSLVDSAPDTTTVVGISGYSEAGKSVFLAAAAHELIDLSSLYSVGGDVSRMNYAATEALQERVEQIFDRHELPQSTAPGVVFGPAPLSLIAAAGGRSVLALFDVAGEDTVNPQYAARTGRFFPMASGVIVLVSPDSISGDRQTPQADRRLIDTLNQLYQAANGMPASDGDQMIVLTLSQCDKLDLPEQVWPVKTLPTSDQPEWAQDRRSRLPALLAESSKAAREVWMDADGRYGLSGGKSIVAAAERVFGARNVRFALVSGLSEDPQTESGEDNGRKFVTDPHPVGCSVPFAHILFADGHL
jgi:hypothetical protein